MKHNGFGPHGDCPRHRLIQTHNWINFKGLMWIVVVGAGILGGLVCAATILQ